MTHRATLQTVRVLSVPSRHVYVQHLSHPGVEDGVVRLPDPPVGGDVPGSQWWPPTALEASWVREHHDELDVFHLHFGFDARSVDQLTELVEALREHGTPLVLTVHDLRNPHHPDPRVHDAQLGVLVPAATALVTLTEGAAAEIGRRWHREAVVLPHPHVVEEPALGRPRPRHDGYVVGIHLKSLRASTDARPVVETVADAVSDLPGAVLLVDVHDEVMAPGFPRHDAGLTAYLREGARDGRFTLREHGYLTDDELWDYLQGLDLSVLPYRFGTHSGWLEACHDLGTTVLTADCGYYREQRPCLTYGTDARGPDRAALTGAVRRAYHERPRWRADPGDRDRERRHLAAAHRDLYRRALAR